MKLRKIILFIALILVVVFLCSALSVFLEYTKTTSKDGETFKVEIPKGASEKAIGEILEEKGVIKHTLSFRLKMKNSPYRGKLSYGVYEMKKGMCLDDVIDIMLHQGAQAEGVKLVIPEGYSAEMIAERCEQLGFCKADEFLECLEKEKFDCAFIKDIPKKDGVKYYLQGYLFPNTYVFKETASPKEIIERLLLEFEKQYSSVKDNNKTSLEMNDIITAASLIEREAKVASERELISGVIQNRLEKGMALQIDASVIYAISDGLYDVERVLYRDLEVESPYNTYYINGLPVGAICNPGIASIKAALNPKKHNYLYYHTDEVKKDGSHIFSETFSQHIQ